MTDFIEALQYGFMLRALTAGSLIAISCAILGVFLVLRSYSLIGEGLSHFAFGTIGLGLLLNVYPLTVTIPLVIVASFWILHLVDKTNIYADAAIGLVSAIGIAIGITLSSKGGGFNVDLFSYLFGDILAVNLLETFIAIGVSTVVIVLISLFYQELFAITFDEEYAQVCGLKTHALNHLLIILTAVTVVLGIKVVGTMLVSSLIIFPAVTALQLGHGFKQVIITAAVVGLISVLAGIVNAFIFDLPAGASIVLINFVLFLLSYLLKMLVKK